MYMRTHREYRQRLRKLRGMLFAHTLADIAGVPHSGPALSRWWFDTFGDLEDRKANRKWGAYFRGALPNKRLRQKLLIRFPQLELTLSDPLWAALQLESNLNWDREINSIEVNGVCISCSVDLTRRLVDNPQPSKLGFVIMLLRTRSLRFYVMRRNASLNFRIILGVACMQPPLCYVQRELYMLLEEFYDSFVLIHAPELRFLRDTAIRDMEMVAFGWRMDALEEIGWVKRRDSDDHLLLWMLFDAKRGIIFPTMPSSPAYARRMKMPDRLRVAWARARKRSRELRIVYKPGLLVDSHS